MSLEKILDKIQKEAEISAEEIIVKASSACKEISDKTASEKDSLKSANELEKQQIDIEVKNRILLPTRLEARNKDISLKRDFIDKVFLHTIDFDEPEYVKVLSMLVKDISDVKGATLHPASGKEDIIKKFVKDKKLDVKIGDSVPDLMGGFILKKGKIEYDCSFVTLIKKLKEKLEPEISRLFDI